MCLILGEDFSNTSLRAERSEAKQAHATISLVRRSLRSLLDPASLKQLQGKLESTFLVAMTILVLIFSSNLVCAEDSIQVLEKATFAGGCFWCMQPFFDKTKGVKETVVGYTGGVTENPAYEEVTSGKTGHAEAIQIVYEPKEVSYEKLLDIFWRNIDPTTKNQQFFDRGTQYRTAIFYHNEDQKRIAERSKVKLGASGKFKDPIVAEIVPAGEFYPAEEYHQQYYKKNAQEYKAYSTGSGREKFFEKIWGKESK